MNTISQPFRPIELRDKPLFQTMFKEENLPHSIYNFANLYMWGRLHRYEWTPCDDTPLVHCHGDGFSLWPRWKDMETRRLLEISNALRKQGLPGNFKFVPSEFLENRPEMGEYFHIIEDRDNADYIYSSEKLAALSGRKLHKKKNLLRQFQKNHPDFLARPMQETDFGFCLDLCDNWCLDSDREIVDFAYETDALRRGLEAYSELKLAGVVLIVQGKIVGFSVYNRQNADTALVHYEKFDRNLKGSAQAINQATAEILKDQYPRLNREQDLGMEGLRRAKESYQPLGLTQSVRLVRKFSKTSSIKPPDIKSQASTG